MFILDTSGSMTTTQSTIDPYDKSALVRRRLRLGSKLYWTDVDVTPDCATTNNIIDGGKYVCEFSRKQIAGIGSYTDTMIQYRDGGSDGLSDGKMTWQTLAAGYSSEYVECQADSGKHGDGIDATRLWPKSGSDLNDLWTDDVRKRKSPGVARRATSVTRCTPVIT